MNGRGVVANFGPKAETGAWSFESGHDPVNRLDQSCHRLHPGPDRIARGVIRRQGRGCVGAYVGAYVARNGTVIFYTRQRC